MTKSYPSHLGSDCRICNVKLSIENTTPSNRKGPPSHRICRSCVNRRGRTSKLEKQKQLENSKLELKPEAMRLLRENGSSIQTAKILGVKKEIILAWIRQEGFNTGDYTKYGRKSSEDRNTVLDLLREGKVTTEIHRLTGISTTSIRTWKKEFENEGFFLSQKKPSTLQIKEEGLQMIRDGNSVAEVASRVGRNRSTVRGWMKAAGLRERNPLKEEALQMIRDGNSVAEVASRVGRNQSTVQKWMRGAGLRKRNPLKEEALQMIRDGSSTAEVTSHLGVSKNSVNTWRKKAGLSKRSMEAAALQMIRDGDSVVDAFDLLRDGKGLSEISSITGISQKTLGEWKRKGAKEGLL